MQIFVQTTHYVIDVSKITFIVPTAAVATVHFVGGTKQTIRMADAVELLEAMKDKALAGLVRCVNGVASHGA